MENCFDYKKMKLILYVFSLVFVGFGTLFNMPVYALGPFLRINVTPAEITFKIADAENPEQYYTCNQNITVVSEHVFPWLKLPWYMGIRSSDRFLKDSLNPNNQIAITQLRWSRDGHNFHQLSQQWQLVNSYFDFCETPYEESITYRLYPEADQSLPAGIYSARIEFDARWLNLPWN